MKDQRVPFIRKTLDSVVESLEATLQVSRWTDSDAIPGPLKLAADRLLERLGTADRLGGSKFQGSPHDAEAVAEMTGAMKRLDAAYIVFRRAQARGPREVEAAATALTVEIDQVKVAIEASA